jgi:hypothetical protein
MIRVTINEELYANALRLTIDERWQGFAVPVFTDEERNRILSDCVRLGWDGEVDGMPGHLLGWVETGDGCWVSNGWIWEEVRQ